MVLLIAVIGVSFLHQWYRLSQMDKEIAYWQQHLDAVKTEQASLNKNKEQLYNESYLAILAREKLFYIFPGEKIWLKSTQSDHILTSVETEGIIAE